MSHNTNNWYIKGTGRLRLPSFKNIYDLGNFLKENPFYLTYELAKKVTEKRQMKVITLKLKGGNVTIFYDEKFIET